jgi:predicted amidophosphoribosyltransferase
MFAAPVEEMSHSWHRHVTRFAVAWAAWLLDIVLPHRCAVCGSSCGPGGSSLCGDCRCALLPIAPPLCARCGAPTAWPVERCRECAGRRLGFVAARAAVAYTGPARRLVQAWKEHALRPVAALAADLVAASLLPPHAALVTFVPPDRDRSLRRGDHPPRRLAGELASRWGIEERATLRRTRTIARQTGLDLAARRRNVRGAFAATVDVPESVALVDDVYTTGATASAAAEALCQAGAQRVYVITFARTVR